MPCASVELAVLYGRRAAQRPKCGPKFHKVTSRPSCCATPAGITSIRRLGMIFHEPAASVRLRLYVIYPMTSIRRAGSPPSKSSADIRERCEVGIVAMVARGGKVRAHGPATRRRAQQGGVCSRTPRRRVHRRMAQLSQPAHRTHHTIRHTGRVRASGDVQAQTIEGTLGARRGRPEKGRAACRTDVWSLDEAGHHNSR